MMKELSFKKITLGSIEKCYAALGVMLGGEPCLFFGGEGDGSMQAFRGANFENVTPIWQGGGGTMSIVPLCEGTVLASRGFYSMVDCAQSTVEFIRAVDGGFTHETIAVLDYLHRFDTLRAPDGARYLIAATLHSGKKDKTDWSTPGHVFAGKMNEDETQPSQVELKPLAGDFYMNHGFCKSEWNGRDAAFTASREGVFVWLPPEREGTQWTCEQLLDFPVSDIAVCDVDGDGQQEIAALMPFHGNEFHIYRQKESGWDAVYTYPVENDFYHAVISGVIGGEKVFVGGARKGAADLFVIRWDAVEGKYHAQQLDAGPGPSNLSLLNAPGADLLLSANRMIFEAAVYRF